MLIIPAIDLKGGRVVRLQQGRMDSAKTYSDDPASMAKLWADLGAKLIHVVDLDGAFAGEPKNKDAILELAHRAGAEIEVGGGIRDLYTIADYLEHGVSRVVLGTSAHSDPELVEKACSQFPNRIVIGIDAREGRVAVAGWDRDTDLSAVELARRYENLPVAGIIYTDISRDGMMTGPSVQSTVELAKAVKLPVIASGGIKTLDHVRELLPHEDEGIVGIITGRAIYEGTLDLASAIAMARGAHRA